MTSLNSKLKTVDKALELLRLFGRHPNIEWSLASLAAETGIHKSTLLRLLVTLEYHAFLERDSVSLRYRLGPAILTLANATEPRIRQLGLPVLQSLTNDTGETSLLHVLSGYESFCIEKVDSAQPVRVIVDIGRRASALAGST